MSRAIPGAIFQANQEVGRSVSAPAGRYPHEPLAASGNCGGALRPTGAVADAVGYQSAAAFQRAFKQKMGVSRPRLRRRR